jgi:hypothetical protein
LRVTGWEWADRITVQRYLPITVYDCSSGQEPGLCNLNAKPSLKLSSFNFAQSQNIAYFLKT